MSRPAKLMTISEAAEELGLRQKRPALWLRRHLLRKERELGWNILVRIGDGKSRQVYKVTMAGLRLSCPELFEKRDEIELIARRMIAAFEKLEERMEDLELRMVALARARR